MRAINKVWKIIEQKKPRNSRCTMAISKPNGTMACPQNDFSFFKKISAMVKQKQPVKAQNNVV